MSALLEFEAVRLVLAGRAVLDDVSVAIDEGEILALAGPSGSGKTSLLRIALGLLSPSRGQVRLRGQLVSTGGRVLVPPEGRGLAVVFQDLALWPHLSVQDNVGFALEVRGIEKADRHRRIGEALVRVNLAGFEARMPSSLSGGERQRVAIARALITEPDLVLFDEALANLDVALKAEILALLRDLFANRRTAALFVTHDAREAKALAGRVAILESGSIAQVGTLEDLAANPRTAFARAFASS
jgi:iron(III) transport system ATP-binding protein